MEEIRRDGEKRVIEVSVEELRLIVGAVNEALNGPYALPPDEWVDLVGQPPERAAALLTAIGTILDR